MALFFAYRTPSPLFQQDGLRWSAQKFIDVAARIGAAMNEGTACAEEDLNSYQGDLHNYLENYYSCQTAFRASVVQ
jgi:hypothetical protein